MEEDNRNATLGKKSSSDSDYTSNSIISHSVLEVGRETYVKKQRAAEAEKNKKTQSHVEFNFRCKLFNHA